MFGQGAPQVDEKRDAFIAATTTLEDAASKAVRAANRCDSVSDEHRAELRAMYGRIGEILEGRA